jgi:hypothetical protein
MKRFLPLAALALAGCHQAKAMEPWLDTAHIDCQYYHDSLKDCGVVERAYANQRAVDKAENRAVVQDQVAKVAAAIQAKRLAAN